MRSIRAILLSGLAFFSCHASADWTAVGAANNIYAAYADKDSIKRSGAGVTMVGLYDFRKQDFTPTGKGLYSTVVLREYDCAARRVRLVSSIDFSGPMGSGEPVDTIRSARRWEHVVEGGIDEAYWKVACSR